MSTWAKSFRFKPTPIARQPPITHVTAPRQNPFSQLNRDLITYLEYVFEPIAQMELDFGHIEPISEVNTMLKDRVQRWKQDYIAQGITQGVERGIKQGRVQGRYLQCRFVQPLGPHRLDKHSPTTSIGTMLA